MDDETQGMHAEGHELASEVSERVRNVISAAEAAASALRHEAEQAAQVRRRTAEQEAQHLLEDAQREADALLNERVKRISALSDSVIERAESIVVRLDRAEEVRRQLQSLVDSLGESAAELAAEMRAESGQAPATPEPSRAEAPAMGVEAPASEAPAAEAPAAEAPAEPAAGEGGSVDDVAAVEDDEPQAEETAAGEPSTVIPLREAAEETAADTAEEDRVEAAEADQELAPRLVALQMAVAGGNRGEVEVHLRETFSIQDPTAILDDVFGRGTDADKRVVWPKSGDGAA
jgi:hypothetical protein